MKYKLVERINPLHPSDPKKYYANPVNSGKVTIKDFAKEIAGRSSLTRGDIENVLTNFWDELPTFLKYGMSVQLGDFGTVRLSISSEGAETANQLPASMIIKDVKVIFTPGAELKKSLLDISFEEEK
jgi:predicted histone-like DNA-binding protein